MNAILAWFARNSVAANLMMWLCLAGGLIGFSLVGQEMIPDIELDVVTVSVVYPGAAPQEVEEAVCLPVEEALAGVSGVKRVRATAAEGVGTVTVELLAGEDVSRRLADIRARVDAIDNLPDEAERPVVRQAELMKQVLSVAVSGPADERSLKRIAERLRDDLVALPEITEVTLGAVRPYEVSIEVSEEALDRHGLGFDQVAQAVRRASLDMPGGTVRASGGEILLRAKGRAHDQAEFEAIPVLTRPDGTRLRVGDVARVVDGFAETDQRATFDGQPTALLHVMRVGDQRVLDISRAVARWVDGAKQSLPPGVSLTVWGDTGRLLDERIGSMLDNAKQGFVLVALVLALFLRFRLAFWVSAGIPVAVLATVALMPALDVTFNWISLMGFILVLGILVDDAIVIGENTYTEQQRAPGDRLGAAIRGVQAVAVPVTFGVLTTVTAFAPMAFVPGTMGRLTRVLPLVVVTCLMLSLVEALLILPAHLGHGKALDAPPTHAVSRRWRALQDRIAAGLDHVTHHVYRRALERVLAARYLALACGVGLVILCGGLVAGGWLRFVFQEPVEGDMIVADVTLAPGAPIASTEAAIAHMERALREVVAEVDAESGAPHGSIARHVMASVGEQPFRVMQSQMPGGPSGRSLSGGANVGEIQLELIDPELRPIHAGELQRRWRERVGAISGAVELGFSNTMVNVGKPVEVELSGESLDELRAAAAWLKQRLAQYPGAFDVADSFRVGKQELQFEITPAAEALGVSLADVGRQVRQAFHGEEVQRIQRGRDDVRVVVRYPEAERRSLSEVEAMRVRTASGIAVPFSAVAKATLSEGFSVIQRVDRERVVTVNAEVDPALGNANAIVAELREEVLPQLAHLHPGVRFEFSGEQAEQRDFLDAMLHGQLLALLVIFALLAIPLRSYTQPLIIMAAIPFGVVGASAGHLLLGYDLSMYSVIGLVALSGVSVNASLVLVDRVNQLRSEGARLEEAVRDAGTSRLRPIFLTSVTTFVGLIPLMFETSMGARFLIPTAIAMGFGALFADWVTLFLVPCLYLVLEDVLLLLRRVPRRRARERIAAAQAEQEQAALAGEPAEATGPRSVET